MGWYLTLQWATVLVAMMLVSVQWQLGSFAPPHPGDAVRVGRTMLYESESMWLRRKIADMAPASPHKQAVVVPAGQKGSLTGRHVVDGRTRAEKSHSIGTHRAARRKLPQRKNEEGGELNKAGGTLVGGRGGTDRLRTGDVATGNTRHHTQQQLQLSNIQMVTAASRVRDSKWHSPPGREAGAARDWAKRAIEDHNAILLARSNANGTKQRGKHGAPLDLASIFLDRLPAMDYFMTGEVHHKTCAVVGNSGTILQTRKGSEINSHEAVLRINYAPTNSFEDHVGYKTTYDLSNRENARFLLKGRRKWRRLPSALLLYEISSPINRKMIFGPLLKENPGRRIEFFAPSFVEHVESTWEEMRLHMGERMGKSFHSKPMSGIFAVIFMMQICDQIDLYGFDAYKSKRTATAPYHYFDRVPAVSAVHSFDLAIEVYKLLGETYPLRIL